MKRQSVREEASSTGRDERLAPDLRNPTAMVTVKAVIRLYGAFPSPEDPCVSCGRVGCWEDGELVEKS